ncbi:MAG: O-antigen ligase family protein [Bacteroidia bacterium]|nr:O-antigen ligase family protein [Bacteroidia bacterium]
MGTIIVAFVTDQLLLLGLPALLLVLFIGIVDFAKLYFLLYASIPLSIALELGGGFSTDIPSEPLMIGLSGISTLYLLTNRSPGFSAFIRHPISILLFLHIGWTLIATINSSYPWISWKFFLAKMWYILPFYILTGILIRRNKDIYKIIEYVLVPLVILVGIILFRHAGEGFSFKSVNFVMGPWFINHVMYAAILVTLFPIVFACFRNQGLQLSQKDWPALVRISILLLFLAGILHSYTRAAMVALAIAIVSYYIIRNRWITQSIVFAIVAILIGFNYLTNNNQYLQYAPEYTKAISHQKFDRLLEATTQGEDVSTMERAHRWIAGIRMAIDKPISGFGPGCFYSAYKPYTVRSFQTYVSNNPEKSGIHNYFLMVFVEQGIPGGIIFLIFSITLLIYGQRIYHQSRNPQDRVIVMGLILSIISIDALLLINDLIETDKVGAFYFTFAAIMVIMDNRLRFQSSN